MKRISVFLTVLLLFLCFVLPCGALGISEKSVIVDKEGLVVLSPEEYLGIDPCDRIHQQDNWYTYKYSDRGYKWYDHGTDNPVDWYRMKEYVDALIQSGDYQLLLHKKPDDDEGYWYLGYTGSGAVERTFSMRTSISGQVAIIVLMSIGDINVYYSLDIATNDLEDTQTRLDTYIYDMNPDLLPQPTNSNGGSSGHWETVEVEVDCPSCTFGRCSVCGGDGKYERYGEVVSCDRDCGSCDGKGKIKQRKQVYVTD